MSLMPRWARELTRFNRSELVLRSVHWPVLQAYARTVRAAFGTPPYAQLAMERAASSATPEAVAA